MHSPEGYFIDRALPEDSLEIRNFFDQHWKKGHIFSRDADFFNYEMTTNNVPNFIVARWEGKIVALLGFICAGENIQDSDLVIATLRVLESHSRANLSVTLIEKLQSMTSGALHCVGITPKVLPLYQLLGFRTGWMDHTWWPNPYITDRKISIASETRPVPTKIDGAIVQFVNKIDETQLTSIKDEGQIIKTRSFLDKRYFKHPIYNYTVLLVKDAHGREQGIGVLRCAEAEGAAALRIVDWMGDPIWFCAFAEEAIRLCLVMGAEYLDCYSVGLNASVLEASGLLPLGETEVAPNYFKPFELKNIAVTFATTAPPCVHLFRGTGDQDRPS